MSAITFATMKTRVALNADNLQSSDPHYAYLGDYVNEAANRVILLALAKDRRAANCFPELRNRRWWDVTVNAQNYLILPETLLVLESVTRTESTSNYAPGSQKEYPLAEEPEASVFGTYDKTATGYPTVWNRAGDQVQFWPTPTTAYRTAVVLYGIKRETALSQTTDTFEMATHWHPTVIKCATALLLEAMNQHDLAAKWWEAVDKDLTATLNLLGLERVGNKVNIRVAGGL